MGNQNIPCGLEQFSIQDRVAIVTGAVSGLGLAVTRGLAACNARLALADCNAEALNALTEELQKQGVTVYSQAIDVVCADQVENFAKNVKTELGVPEILINCAGITRRMPFETFEEEAWDLVLDVNLKGTYLMCKTIGAMMLEAGKGSIINFGSLGSAVAIPQSAAYCASKGGVAMLTKTIACEWATRGVRVNAVLPGTFKTPLLEQCVRENPDYGETMLARFPMRRFADPGEIAGACIFLASDASSYVTGHLLAVDGGCIAF